MTDDPASLSRRMILDIATRRSAESLEVQILYLLAAALVLPVVEPWAIIAGYLLIQLTEIHGLRLARMIFEAAIDPNDMLQRFATPIIRYKWAGACAVSIALGNGFMHAVTEWQLGVLAIWCIGIAYYVFPAMYCARALYGSILIMPATMAAFIIACFFLHNNMATEFLIANLGLCLFSATAAAFIGRQIRTDYIEGLNRELELGRSVRELDRQNTEKTDFVGHLSHELRTPMNGLMGMAALLRQELELPEQRKKVDIMLRSGATLVELLNNSLDLTKLEAGAVRLDTGSCALRPLLEDQVQLYSATAEAKDMKITLDVSPDVPEFLLMDSLRVMQVVGNLVSNAVKFSECGTVHVTADYDRSASTPTVVVMVRDQGIGIAPGRISGIFSAYSQGDNTLPREYPGAGLGLAISSRLADLMGGSIKVGSKLGEGSTFYFTFVAIETPSLITDR